eukprot:4997400-Prorocentrum_lima.AAC.1
MPAAFPLSRISVVENLKNENLETAWKGWSRQTDNVCLETGELTDRKTFEGGCKFGECLHGLRP